jgi:hypothetical protein
LGTTTNGSYEAACRVTLGDQATIEDGKITEFTWVPLPQRQEFACEFRRVRDIPDE